MAIYDLYSKRQRRLRGDVPDVYQYEDIPDTLRVQIAQIIEDGLGNKKNRYEDAQPWRELHDVLCREYGLFSLNQKKQRQQIDAANDTLNFLLSTGDIEQALDVIEIGFRFIEIIGDNPNLQRVSESKVEPSEAIEELNQRFREHGVGFQYESGEIIRVDSQIVHDSAVKPALHLLRGKQYDGANEEYLRAHEHYRHGRYGECLNDCLKAFESTLKSICDKRRWDYQSSDTAKKLINTCFQHNLIPTFMQTQFSSLQQNLESGVPTVRNKLGGHGQGSSPRPVTPHIAAYQLHLTASTILLLVECEKSLPE